MPPPQAGARPSLDAAPSFRCEVGMGGRRPARAFFRARRPYRRTKSRHAPMAARTPPRTPSPSKRGGKKTRTTISASPPVRSQDYSSSTLTASTTAKTSSRDQRAGQLLPTVEVTARGRHLYFRYPSVPVRNLAGKIAPGIDVRGDGGYVLAPPPSERQTLLLVSRLNVDNFRSTGMADQSRCRAGER